MGFSCVFLQEISDIDVSTEGEEWKYYHIGPRPLRSKPYCDRVFCVLYLKHWGG